MLKLNVELYGHAAKIIPEAMEKRPLFALDVFKTCFGDQFVCLYMWISGRNRIPNKHDYYVHIS